MYFQFTTAVTILLSVLGFTPETFTYTISREASLMSMMITNPIDTLPVVVHVIHTGDPIGAPDNPPDSLIMSLIGLMNEAFQKDGPYYGGADIELAFQLTNRSPECTSTTGINRLDGSSVPNYLTGGITTDLSAFPNSADEFLIKALSRWPNTDYLNIWIVNEIDGNPNVPGGYAFFPEYNSALNDGIVLNASVVNGTNKTIIHELGHYFYLYHTFGFAWTVCETESDCYADGDLICDTENCIYEFDCSEPINICSGEDWIIVDSTQDYTVLNNYMGYTDCQWMFTEGQKTRMHNAIYTFRPGLLTSLALEAAVPFNMPVACEPAAINGLSPYYGIERVEINEFELYSNTSEADGDFYIDRTCNQQIQVSAGDTVWIRITGSYTNWSQIRGFLDYNNDGVFTSPQELILAQDGGMVEDTFIVPISPVILCESLRLRVVSDHPSAPVPTACLLTGTPEEGVGQIEDYTIYIMPRDVMSLGSGDWDDPSVWSCNCIPSESDFVQIQSGDTITITPSMGLIECADLHLSPGAHLQLDGEMHVASTCD